MEGEQVNVDYGNWEKKAAESVTKKLESTREMPVQQVARTITLVLEILPFFFRSLGVLTVFRTEWTIAHRIEWRVEQNLDQWKNS